MVASHFRFSSHFWNKLSMCNNILILTYNEDTDKEMFIIGITSSAFFAGKNDHTYPPILLIYMYVYVFAVTCSLQLGSQEHYFKLFLHNG